MTSVVLLGEAQARKLTDRIKQALDNLAPLIAEAHDSEAWRALGYKSWAEYVEREFDFSNQQSYHLIDQGRAMAALSEAAGYPVQVTIRQAKAFKKLPAIQKQGITQKLMSGAEARQVLREELPVTYSRASDGVARDFDEWDGETAIYRCRHCGTEGPAGMRCMPLVKGAE